MKESGTNVRKFGIRDKFSYMLGDVGCNLVFTLANSYLLVFYTYSNRLLQFSKRKFPNKPAIISQHLPGACLKKVFCNLPHHIFLTRLKLNTQ